MEELLEFDFGELPLVSSGPPRLSVSALRDYRRCPRYYYEKRINKRPEKVTHHMAAGNIVHSAFYMAYAEPVVHHSTQTGRSKIGWRVTGEFAPQKASALFTALWNRVPVRPGSSDETRQKAEQAERQILSELPAPLHAAYALLADDVPYVENFAPGSVKALKGEKQHELKAGWGEHFKKMLEASLEQPFSYPVREIEREVNFYLGGVEMKAYIDIVLDASKEYGDGAEVHIDLKSGYSKPNEEELYFDDQIQTYYLAGNPREFWLYHMRSGELFAIDRNQPLIDSLNGMAAQDAISIENEFFPKRFDKSECSRCAYRKICHGI
jgi:CRISPR/Cas system-associated exonuclease Cas4 (RecB family)